MSTMQAALPIALTNHRPSASFLAPTEDSAQARNKARVADVKRRYGNRLIGHPGYAFNPRHSNNKDIYIPARANYLAAIATAAKRDREANPAFLRADAIRNIHSGEVQ